MLEIKFNEIKSNLNTFKFTSLEYSEYEEVKHFELINNDEGLILLYGYDIEGKNYEWHWACSESEELIKALIKRNEKEKITFVPKEWAQDLKSIGFDYYGVWIEYFAQNINVKEGISEINYLDETKAKEASEVMVACKGVSRGFSGQTPEWVVGWINKSEKYVGDNIDNPKMIYEMVGDSIAGVIAVGVYGEKEKRTLWIRELAVHPDFQNRGVGKILMEKAFNYGVENKAKASFLMVDEFNIPGIKLYEKMGFVKTEFEGQIDMMR